MFVPLIFLLVIFVTVVSPFIKFENNVCRYMKDYSIKDVSPNCWNNPDVGSTPAEIINRWGYPFESHQVTTEDGYSLSLLRIPHKGKPPVMLVHGILTSSLTWLSLGKKSLAFELYNLGFDVWIVNYRGTILSTGHVDKKIPPKEYWDFSWYEMGYYDLPAFVDFIRKNSPPHEKILYIGHSMGTTTSYVYATTRKDHAEKNLRALISVAPVAYMHHMNIPLNLISVASEKIRPIFRLFGIFKIGYSTQRERADVLSSCVFGFISSACDWFVYFATSLLGDSIEPHAIPMIIAQSPQGTSWKTWIHYTQEITTDGDFKQYDYGSEGNLGKYGTAKPPRFNVSEITIPTFLLYGKKDTLATEENVVQLYEELTCDKSISAIAKDGKPEYNHFDFIVGKDIDPFYDVLFKIIDKIYVSIC